jgi:hypothetical protein
MKNFLTIDDAKGACAIDPTCNGITGFPGNYTLRTGTIILPRESTTETSWKKQVAGRVKLSHGLYAGSETSSDEIPRAFADDYKGTITLSSAGSSIGSSIGSAAGRPPTPSMSDILATYSTAVNAMSSVMNSVAAAAASILYQESIENSNGYYTLIGVERHLNTSALYTTADNGVCIGPCDSALPLHDPIMLYKSPTHNITSLYGTTCHDGTKMTINLPNIPAVYVPQTGISCPDEIQATGPSIVSTLVGAVYGAGGSTITRGNCVQQCLYDQKDAGSSCQGDPTRRSYSAPRYSCASIQGTTQLDSVCLFPCNNGDTRVGEYCEPPQTLSNFPGQGSGSSPIN